MSMVMLILYNDDDVLVHLLALEMGSFDFSLSLILFQSIYHLLKLYIFIYYVLVAIIKIK